MDSLSFVGFFFAFFLSFMCLSQGYTFYAGGKEGWVLNPSESYDHWARRNRFQVNDTIGKPFSSSLSLLNLNLDI